MVEQGCCKEYTKQGIPMISFQEDLVGAKEGTKSANTIAKAMHTRARTYAH
jgi:hypothetical protein